MIEEQEGRPAWADALRRRYLKGEACEFVLTGNIHDLVVHEKSWFTLVDYLGKVLLDRSKDIIIHYNVSLGVQFIKKSGEVPGLDELLLSKRRDKILPALENILFTCNRVALIIDYAETLAPMGETTFFSDDDRQSVVTLHRWSQSSALDRSDNMVLLLAENATELHAKLTANPKAVTLQVPLPDAAVRAAAIDLAAPGSEAGWREQLVEFTAGLKSVQIKTLLQPSADAPAERAERHTFLLSLLKGSPHADERAAKLADLTLGMTHDEIRKLVAPTTIAPHDDPGKQEILRLISARKREMIERECMGLIEFVDGACDFSAVGGIDSVKAELTAIARNMREGHRAHCPMGLLFTGPMGTGKTFVAEAFVREAGLTAIKLKSFRSKWVGSTEANLERIFSVVQAIGQVIIIIDEGDRAFGNNDGDGDGGTSSRVIGRMKEFMSDTRNRGRVMFILMTNRPDKLDVDIKRPGRLDKKIPFFMPQDPSEIEAVLGALVKRHQLQCNLDWPQHRQAIGAKLVGYSNAELEAVILLANDYASDSPLTTDHISRAIFDYLPSRDTLMLEFMELLAVFEASNRRMLPEKYASMDSATLQGRLATLRSQVGQRR